MTIVNAPILATVVKTIVYTIIIAFFVSDLTETCAECAHELLPGPGPDETVVTVSDAAELQNAIDAARGETTIYLEKGVYDVSKTGGIVVTRPHITLRSRSGNRDDAVIMGGGMDAEGIGHGVVVDASHVTVADLTIRDVQNHGIFVSPVNSPAGLLFHNIRCVDTGQQIFKSSGIERPKGPAVIEWSTFEYTNTLDDGNYTNGIDLLNSHGWVIRDNIIRNVKAVPGAGLAGPAILIWKNSSGTIIERNRIIDCDMGIFFGNSSEKGISHSGGIISNNFIRGYAKSDAAIGIVRSKDAQVLNNTVYSPGGPVDWSIEIRYPESTGCLIANNLMDEQIAFRDGATAVVVTNIDSADKGMFVDTGACDLHLVSRNNRAVDAGTWFKSRSADIDCDPIDDGKVDIGADETQLK